MNDSDMARPVDSVETADPRDSSAYEAPRIMELGTLAELTHGGGGGGSDDGEVGST